MDSLPDCVLLQILSRLDNSADVARCRVASKAFDTVFPGLRSVNLVCTYQWYIDSLTGHNRIKHFRTVFLNLLSKLECVESVCLSLEPRILPRFDNWDENVFVTDVEFLKLWLPRVSASLKSLAITDRKGQSSRNLLPLISKYCHNLVNLSLERACLSTDDMSPMPMLTTLTLYLVTFDDNVLNELNTCLPNLQALNLVHVFGLENPVIHLLHLKTCVLEGLIFCYVKSLTLITPNLITLTIQCNSNRSVPLHIEAPMLSQFSLVTYDPKDIFSVTRFDNLKALSLDIDTFSSELPVTKSVEILTLGSKDSILRSGSELTLGKVFTAFPNVTCLNIHSGAWLDLEAGLNTQGCEVLNGGKGLKTICAYLNLADPLLTFSSVACLLDQFVSLSKVLFLIHSDVVGTVSEDFAYRCMARWPGLKWRWGIWSRDMKDCWITYDAGQA